MGVDASIEAEIGRVLSPEEMTRLTWELCEALGQHMAVRKPRDWSTDECEEIASSTRIVIDNPWRYYSPGYSRGPWPDIYAAIEWTKRRFPGCTVYYGGDDADEAVTPERIDEIWQHFANTGGQEYERHYVTGHTCCGGPTVTFQWRGKVATSSCCVCGSRYVTTDGRNFTKEQHQ